MIAKYVVAYVATGIAFAVIDSIWLRSMYTRLYQPEIGELIMKDGFRLGPAVIFYLLYILGMMIFAVGPALGSGKWQTALLWGALMGVVWGRPRRSDAVTRVGVWPSACRS